MLKELDLPNPAIAGANWTVDALWNASDRWMGDSRVTKKRPTKPGSEAGIRVILEKRGRVGNQIKALSAVDIR